MTEYDYRLVIRPPTRIAVPRFEQIWDAREVLVRFGARDVTLRYRQTALGVVWVILQPLLGAGVFSIVFGGVAKLPSGRVPYLVFSFAGLMGWNLFSGIVSRSSSSLISNASLVSKVFFPRIIVPLAVVYSVFVDFIVAFAMMFVLIAIYGVNLGWALALLPIWILLIAVLASGIGFIASSLMVSYRDVAYVIPVAVQILLYATPIAYSYGAIPRRYHLFFDVNPLTWLIQEFRWALLDEPGPSGLYISLSVIVPVAVFILGVVFFESRERSFADVI